MASTDFFRWHWLSLHGFVSMLALGLFLATSHSLRQRRNPSAAMAWLLFFVLVPYLALPLYLLIGTRKRIRPVSVARAVASARADVAALRIRMLAGTLSLPDPSTCDSFDLHEDGSQALRSLLSIIDNAKARLDLCTFVFGRDVLGRELLQHLEQAARRGVQVRFMIDGVGRYLGGHPDLAPLKSAGVNVALFAPPLAFPFAGKANLRNHRKMAIADAERFWIGGRNFAADYFEGDGQPQPKEPPWLDLSFELRGAIAAQAQQQFDKDWEFAIHPRATVAPQPLLPALPDAAPSVQLVPSGPDQADDTVYTLLVSCCFTAKTRILAVSPYFVPDATLQMALTLAARRGVSVDLVIPRRSNHRIADMARHPSLRELSRSGARVWLTPGMIHAKAVVFDDEFALAGTANLDERSLLLNYEMMVGFYRPEDVARFAGWILRQREGALPYQARSPGVARELREGVIRWLAFQL